MGGIFQLHCDYDDDVPTGGLVTVVAFSNGTQSSTLDLPSRQLCSSITASSIRKRPECRLGDIEQIKLKNFKYLPNNSGRGCALRREAGGCKERPVDESQEEEYQRTKEVLNNC